MEQHSKIKAESAEIKEFNEVYRILIRDLRTYAEAERGHAQCIKEAGQLSVHLWRSAYLDRLRNNDSDYETNLREYPRFHWEEHSYTLIDKKGESIRTNLLAVVPIYNATNKSKADLWYGLVWAGPRGDQVLEWKPVIMNGALKD